MRIRSKVYRISTTLIAGAVAAWGFGCGPESAAVPEKKEGLAATQQAVSYDAEGTFQCRAPDGAGWTTIRNTPSGFVIGNCYNGWTLKRSKKAEAAGFWWDGGYIIGHFNGYGWIRADSNVMVNSDPNGYTDASTSISDIADRISCPYSSDCGDGNSVFLRTSCTSYANRGVDPVGELGPGTRLIWRYRTLDQRWAMVRIPGVSCSHSSTGENHALGWRFVPASCIEYPPSSSRCVVDRNNNSIYCGTPNTLRMGQPLARGQEIYSPNGRARLVHQPDGNVVLYRTSDNAALWATNTVGQATTHAVQQTDGNFVLYNGGSPLWSSGTWNQSGAVLSLQDDCNLVIYSGSTPVWSTGTWWACQ